MVFEGMWVGGRHRYNLWNDTSWQHHMYVLRSRRLINWARSSYEKFGAPFIGLNVEQYGKAHDLEPIPDEW